MWNISCQYKSTYGKLEFSHFELFISSLIFFFKTRIVCSKKTFGEIFPLMLLAFIFKTNFFNLSEKAQISSSWNINHFVYISEKYEISCLFISSISGPWIRKIFIFLGLQKLGKGFVPKMLFYNKRKQYQEHSFSTFYFFISFCEFETKRVSIKIARHEIELSAEENWKTGNMLT